MEGRIEAIYVSPAAGRAMESVAAAVVREGQGIEGDRYGLGSGRWSGRGSDPLTLVEAEVVEALALPGPPLPPAALRRNLLVRGVPLEELVGRRFRVGPEVVLEGLRPCDPCDYLEALAERPGLKAALAGAGGLRAAVVTGGVLRVGDVLEVY